MPRRRARASQDTPIIPPLPGLAFPLCHFPASRRPRANPTLSALYGLLRIGYNHAPGLSPPLAPGSADQEDP